MVSNRLIKVVEMFGKISIPPNWIKSFQTDKAKNDLNFRSKKFKKTLVDTPRKFNENYFYRFC